MSSQNSNEVRNSTGNRAQLRRIVRWTRLQPGRSFCWRDVGVHAYTLASLMVRGFLNPAPPRGGIATKTRFYVLSSREQRLADRRRIRQLEQLRRQAR